MATTTKKTEEKYSVPKGEETSAHVVIQKFGFNPANGERIHQPVIQKYNTRESWENLLDFHTRLGLEIVEVLHVPDGWAKDGSETAAAKKAAKKAGKK